jgi:hypothetical protein
MNELVDWIIGRFLNINSITKIGENVKIGPSVNN